MKRGMTLFAASPNKNKHTFDVLCSMSMYLLRSQTGSKAYASRTSIKTAGFKWSSTAPAVQDCLHPSETGRSSAFTDSSMDTVVFSATVGEVRLDDLATMSCELKG